MSSPCRNPERWAVIARLLRIALAAVLAVAANNAGAQQDTAPSTGRGPNEVSVTGLFPSGGAPPPQDPIGARFEGNELAIANGEELYGQMNCSGCHFNGGGGMGPALMSGHCVTAYGLRRSTSRSHRAVRTACRPGSSSCNRADTDGPGGIREVAASASPTVAPAASVKPWTGAALASSHRRRP